MIIFGGLVGLLTLLALFFILPPVLGLVNPKPNSVSHGSINLMVLREQLKELDADLAAGLLEQNAYLLARKDLTIRLADSLQKRGFIFSENKGSVKEGVFIGILFICITGSLYAFLGTPDGIMSRVSTVQSESKSDQLTMQQASTMVEQLAQQMASNPDNLKGWLLLARSYTALARYEDASKAYAHMLSQFGNDKQLINAQFLTDYADVLAMQNGKSLIGEPEILLKRAVGIDPQNVNALVLLGSANFERGDYQEAIKNWKKVVNLARADSDVVQIVLGNLDEAQERLSMSSSLLSQSPNNIASLSESVGKLKKIDSATELSGVVELDAAVRSQVSDSDTVFIFVRAVNGPKFPLVVLRKQVKDLPFNFVLDDSMRMMPDVSLSKYSALIVGARVSKTGNAMPEKGDLEATIAPIPPGTSNLKVRIGLPSH